MSRSNSNVFLRAVICVIVSLLIGALAFFIFFMASDAEYSRTEVYLKNLDIEYTVNEDGTMNVTEKWETVFTGSHYRAGSKVFNKPQRGEEYKLQSVRDLTNGKDYIFDESAYEDEGYCTQFTKSGRTYFEWYDDFGSETRIFEIKYTVKNAVVLYNDMSELYWKFIPENFELSVDNAVCTVTLPQSAISQHNKIYGHIGKGGAGYTNAMFEADGTARFEAKEIPSETYAEMRILMDKDAFAGGYKIDADGYQTALKEESKWANDTAGGVKNILILMAADIVIGAAAVVVSAVICIRFIYKYRPFKPDFLSDYYREPPQNISPGVMSKLYFFYKGITDTGNIMTATLLSICTKGHIRLSDTGKDIVINFDKDADTEPLTNDELCLYRIFEQAAEGNSEISMKQVNKYIKSHQTDMHSKYQRFESLIDSGFSDMGYKDSSIRKGMLTAIMIISIILTVIFIFISMSYYGFLFSIAGLAFAAAMSIMTISSVKRLTRQGQESFTKWHAFGRFMQEFTLLDEKELPSLELWEKYLVYATAMGISKQVLKQIKVAYPQLSDSEYMGMYMPYSYLYLMHAGNMTSSFDASMSRISNSVRSMQTAMNYTPNSSGHGGGFSGGGGFGGGGGGGGFR